MAWFILCMSLIGSTGISANMCTAPGNLPVFTEGTRLTGAVFLTLTSPGPLTCARECLTRSLCCTFNIHLVNGDCELNWACDADMSNGVQLLTSAPQYVFFRADVFKQELEGGCRSHNCSKNAKCRETGSGSYVCATTHCENINVAHGTVNYVVSKVTPVDQSVPFLCDVGYTPCGTLHCQSDGTWTTAECKPLHSCADVHDLNPAYGDGEYWLFPPVFNGVAVKVYCNDMASTPGDFISLATPYFMNAPKVRNDDCAGEIEITNTAYVGITIFSKFGLNIQTMDIIGNLYTFANKTSDTEFPVGFVLDCYTPYPNPCGPQGHAVIDMRGTGLKLKETVAWSPVGSSFPPQVSRSYDGQVIDVMCGGLCGSCFIQGAALLTYVLTDTPSADTAISPSC